MDKRRFHLNASLKTGLWSGAVVVLMSLLGPWILKTFWGEVSPNLSHPASPSLGHLLGTNTHGKDLLLLVVLGLRSSLVLVGVAVPGIFGFAVLFGLLQGYFMGKTDLFLQRYVEIIKGIPLLMLLVILGYYDLLTFQGFLLILFVFKWTSIAQLTRGLTLIEREKAYVLQARFMGLSSAHILGRFLLPNVLPKLLSQIPSLAIQLMNYMIVLEFIGVSFETNLNGLGQLLTEGKSNLYAPWILMAGMGGVLAFVFPLVCLSYGLNRRSQADDI